MGPDMDSTTEIAQVGLCGEANPQGLACMRQPGPTKGAVHAGPHTSSDYIPSFLPSSACSGLTSLTLPHVLTTVGYKCFWGCKGLTSVVFRPPVSRGAFIAWAVGSSRNRANWQLTTVKRLRNVLRFVTVLVMWSRDVATVDPDGSRRVFMDCTGLKW